MRGQRGSGGVISGDTDLGDLRGHPQSSMSWVCETPGWVHGWMANPRGATPPEPSRGGIASDGLAGRSVIH